MDFVKSKILTEQNKLGKPWSEGGGGLSIDLPLTRETDLPIPNRVQ